MWTSSTSDCARSSRRSRPWNATSGPRLRRGAPPWTPGRSDPVLYAYAISRSAQPPRVRGLKGAALRAVGDARQGVCALVSEHQEPPVAAEPEDFWAHEAVVESAMHDGAVL